LEAAPQRVPVQVDVHRFKALSESEREDFLALLKGVNEHLDDDSLNFLCGYLEAEHEESCD